MERCFSCLKSPTKWFNWNIHINGGKVNMVLLHNIISTSSQKSYFMVGPDLLPLVKCNPIIAYIFLPQ